MKVALPVWSLTTFQHQADRVTASSELVDLNALEVLPDGQVLWVK